MKRSTLYSALPGVLSIAFLAATWCSNTTEGVKEDTANNVQATQEAAEKTGEAVAQTAHEAGKAVSETAHEAGQKMSEAARDAGKVAKDAGQNVAGALDVTPKIKVALTADEALNDSKNKIDVDTAEGVVHLKGHVTSAALKQKASMIAKKELADMKSTDKLDNQLQVAP